MSTNSIVVLSAGLSQPSSTRLLADRLGQAAVLSLGERGHYAELVVIELREHAQAITNAMITGFVSAELAEVHEAITRAHAVIAVTPIFSASYSGLFKSFFDGLDVGVLDNTIVQIGATAGTARHSLAVEFAIRPLFSYLKATSLPTAVFAATEDWGGGNEADALGARIARAGDELASALEKAPRPDAAGDVFVPFEQQLRRLGVN